MHLSPETKEDSKNNSQRDFLRSKVDISLVRLQIPKKSATFTLPRDKDELDDVVEEQESFLITPWKVVGEDSALGLVAGGEQGSTTISGKVKVSFCLRLWELLLGLQLKGEFGAEDKSLSCFLNDNTVLSDSVDDWTSRLICGTASVLGDLSSSSSSSSMMSSALSTAES